MIKSLKNIFKELNSKTTKIMNYGFLFSLAICVISLVILTFYNLFVSSPFLFLLGITTLKFSFFLIVEFIICGIVVDSISKQKI